MANRFRKILTVLSLIRQALEPVERWAAPLDARFRTNVDHRLFDQSKFDTLHDFEQRELPTEKQTSSQMCC